MQSKALIHIAVRFLIDRCTRRKVAESSHRQNISNEQSYLDVCLRKVKEMRQQHAGTTISRFSEQRHCAPCLPAIEQLPGQPFDNVNQSRNGPMRHCAGDPLSAPMQRGKPESLSNSAYSFVVVDLKEVVHYVGGLKVIEFVPC